MRPFFTLCLATVLFSKSAYAVGLGSLSAGDLVISEVFPYPAAVAYNRGQWFEIYNDSGSSVDLNGLVVTNGDAESFTVGSSVTVANGEYALFAVRSNTAVNGGLAGIDYVYSFSDLSLVVSGDSLTISFGGTTFDSASYNTANYPDPYGSSISLIPSALDATSNDTAGNWCAATSTFGDGDYGTPGLANDTCPADISTLLAGDLVVTEVMATPSASDYNKGEWFEVYNASGSFVDLDGLVVSDGTETFTVTGPLEVRSGEYAVFAARDNMLQNGGIPVVDYRYVYSTEMTLASSDSIILSFGGTTFDTVTYGGTFPGSSGVAMELANTDLDATSNNSAVNWCAASIAYGDGDLGTPGSDNGDCDPDSDGDGFNEDVDCDDDNPAVNPGAAEICNDIDDDCNDLIDDSPSDGATYYADTDTDGYGDPGDSVDACERPSGYRPNNLDCDDTDVAINPGATETCDGTDDNCSGDENDAIDGTFYYNDVDGDGYGATDDFVNACAQPVGYLVDGTDCDDIDGTVNPGESETCDGTDNNCSGDEDDASDASTFYADTDSDGYGDPANTKDACTRPSGYRPNNLDCDDTDIAINPGAAETCDGTDDNCSGDENDASDAVTYYADTDGDSYGDPGAAQSACAQPSGYLVDSSDCDDTTALVNPGESETCDGTDNNCSGDEDDASDASTFYADTDSDGYGDPANTKDACTRPSGYRPNNLDCDDTDIAINPGESETCDGTDNNCSGDETDASDVTTFYADTDGDSYGDPATTQSVCNQPSGYLVDNTDCDDTTALVNPGESETCDGTDNNCSGDETDASDATTYYADTDGDGYGNPASSQDACAQPSGYTIEHTDCDDTAALVNPGESETCDGTDNNCSGDESDASDAVTYYADTDGDSYGDAGNTQSACAQPSGYLVDSSDCDDTAAAVFPGAAETCADGIDQDCDGIDSLSTCDMDLGDAQARMYGETTLDLMGYSVASGDLDGDGNDDIITAARLDDDAGADAGAAYVFYGPLTGSINASTADSKVTGESAGDYAGISVDAADVDSDGYDDFIIGALNDDTTGSNAGAAYVVLGPVSGSIGLSTADAKWTGEAAGDNAGRNIAAAGDVNNDGYEDMLVSAPNNDDVDTNAGKAYLLYGPISTDDSLTNADSVISGAYGQDRAGYWLDGANDVDGDGNDDILIGAYRADTTEEVEGNTVTTSNTGAAYIVYGPPSAAVDLASADVTMEGEAVNDQAGSVVAGAGDLNGDGYADVLIGARHADSNGADAGTVYLVNGSASLSSGFNLSTADAYFTGEAAGDQAGRGFDGAGDIDNDGHGDILIGAYKNDNGGSSSGSGYLVLGPFSGAISLATADAIFSGESSSDQVGVGVYGGADISNDGTPDLLFGGSSAGSGGTDGGGVYLILGETWR